MAAPHPEFDLDGHLFFWLTQVIGARDRRLNAELKDFGLRVPEWRALAALYSRRHCTMSVLADLASIDRTTLTRTVDRMQDAGWLARIDEAIASGLTATICASRAWSSPPQARDCSRAYGRASRD